MEVFATEMCKVYLEDISQLLTLVVTGHTINIIAFYILL